METIASGATKVCPELGHLLKNLDEVAIMSEKPSTWPGDAVMALLVGATTYHSSIALSYRSALTAKAIKHWGGPTTTTPTIASTFIEVLDRASERGIDLNVAYFQARGIVGRIFDEKKYDSDHGLKPKTCRGHYPAQSPHTV